MLLARTKNQGLRNENYADPAKTAEAHKTCARQPWCKAPPREVGERLWPMAVHTRTSVKHHTPPTQHLTCSNTAEKRKPIFHDECPILRARKSVRNLKQFMRRLQGFMRTFGMLSTLNTQKSIDVG